MAKNHIVEYIAILRDVDPGAVSGGGKKSKRARTKSGFSLARLDIFPPPLTAPGSPSPRMIYRGRKRHF